MSIFKPVKNESWVRWFLLPQVQELHLEYLAERLGSKVSAQNVREQQAFAAAHWFNQLDTAEGEDKRKAQQYLRNLLSWMERREQQINDML
jgi:hypothetical protein